jgi:hypothetical protein
MATFVVPKAPLPPPLPKHTNTHAPHAPTHAHTKHTNTQAPHARTHARTHTHTGVMIDVWALNYLLDQHLKGVKDKLELVNLPLTSFATQWFMCAYVNVLPLSSVLRVWDWLLLLGPVVLFRIALALLKAIEGELGLATEMEDAMAALQRARNLEIETVLTIAQVCFGEAVVDLAVLMQLRHKATVSKLS